MTSKTFDETDVVRDSSGRFDEKRHTAPESELPTLLSRHYAVTSAERNFLTLAKDGGLTKDELRTDAGPALASILGSMGASSVVIRAEQEEYDTIYWVHAQDGVVRDDFDSFDVRVADIIKATSDGPEHIAEIPGMARAGNDDEWTYTPYSDAGCDSCGVAGREPGEKVCAECAEDADYEFWVGTYDTPFEYGPYGSEGAAKSVIAARQPENEDRLYITQENR